MPERPGPWRRHAAQWGWVGPPLRPAAEDVAEVEGRVRAWHSRRSCPQPQALLLGVTPELAGMGWPPGTRVLAVDRSLPMISGVWPGPRPGHGALCASWTELPVADARVHVVVGDGSYNVLASGDEYGSMTRALRRALRGDGLLVLRFFVRPERAEPLDRVTGDIAAGRIANFNVLKWRLAMALHGSLAEGVRLADIWDAWHAAVPEPAALFARQGWPAALLGTLDAYRGVAARYTFPTLAEARAALAEAFVEEACTVPAYELGERCPTLAFRPR